MNEYLGDELSYEDLKGLAEENLKYQRELERELRGESGLSGEDASSETEEAANSTTKRDSGVFAVALPEREQKRATVLLAIQMRRAGEHPDVRDFRDARLGGGLLSVNDAEAYFQPGPKGSISDDKLADLARRLGTYYNWHQDDAAWFVLTGEAPTLHPLAVDFYTHTSVYGPGYGEITLHVEPWIPADEVKKAFLNARDRLRSGAGPGTVSVQRLEVLRFVEEEVAKRGHRSPFPKMFEMWNKRYPGWSYADYTAFSKAYREARQEVLYPKYDVPQREQTPNMERQEARNRQLKKQAQANIEKFGPPKFAGGL